jgi:hypothetical protein
MLEYSEYKSLMDTLNRADRDTVYEDLMKKETSVLSNVNAVVKEYRDHAHEKKQFINMSINDIIHKVFTELPMIMMEINQVKTPQDYVRIVTKGDRLVYLGIIIVMVAFCVFFAEISS